MRNSRRVLLLTAVLLIAGGCNSTPLPEEIPTHFYYSWRFERLEASDAPNPGDRPHAILLSVDQNGRVDYEIAWGDPKPAAKKGDLSIDEENLLTIYGAVRAAKLFEKSNSYQGQDLALGRETFYVIGRNSEKEVIVEGTSLADLEALRETLLTNLPLTEIMSRPEEIQNVFILDWRSTVFHKGNCPLVQDIPEASQRKYTDPYAALNRGGTPCGQCNPLGGE